MTATNSQDPHDTHDETRPLLQYDEERIRRKPRDSRTALPYLQLAILCFLRVLDPLNFTQIFPYINQLVADLGVAQDATKIGWYSGLVESAFALCQLIAIYPWASASDGVGRRPVIIFCAFGLTIATIAFGFSKTFFGILGARALAGLFSGNVAVIPSVLCQITDSTNQSFAFSFFGLWWPLGAILGPLIGGFLSNPVTNFPNQFGDSALLREYPYLLPCLLIAGMNCLGLIFSYFFLKETNTKDVNPVLQDKHLSTKDLLSIPIIRSLSASACCLSFISTAFDALFVLFCYSPIHGGGLALSVESIGYALAASGGISAMFQLFFMPVLLERLDHAKFYHFCVTIWPFVFLGLPLLNVVARSGIDPDGNTVNAETLGLLWAGILAVLFAARVATLPYSINMLLVKRYTPAPSALGSVSGLIQFFICFSRAFSPILASWAFTISVEKEILGGYMWAILIAIISLQGSLLSKRIVEEASKI